MALSLFGFTIGREDRQSELKSQSFITPVSEDGTSTVSAGGYFGTYVDIDASARSESELISLILWHLDDVVVLGPASLRASVVASLRELVATHG